MIIKERFRLRLSIIGFIKGFSKSLSIFLGKKGKRRKTPETRVKFNIGTSITKRPKAVKDRKEFGHWEIDTVIGNKTKSDQVLLTLVERQTRFEVILKIDGKVLNQSIKQ